MKNNKGFSLLEIISVITIIVLLAIIIVPIIDKNIKDAQKMTDKAQIESVENAAFVYAIKYRNEIPTLDQNNFATISIDTLIGKGLVREKDINEINNEEVSRYSNVIITIIDNKIKTILDINNNGGPYIVLHGPEKITMEKGTQYNELGAVVINIYGEGLKELNPSYIESGVDNETPGTYYVEYSTPENPDAIVRRTVVVAANSTSIDNEKPKITLVPPLSITISKGSTYTDPGATAIDNKDGTITSRIVKTGTVNTKQKGTYYIKYDVTDLSGNKADTVIRTVIVN